MTGMLTIMSCSNKPENLSEDLMLEQNWQIISSADISEDGSDISTLETIRGYNFFSSAKYSNIIYEIFTYIIN